MGRAIEDRRERVFLMTKVCTHGRDATVAMRQLRGVAEAAQDRLSGSLAGARVRLRQRSGSALRARRRHRGARSREAGRQGPVRRLHRTQGSRHPPADAVASAIRSTACQLPLNCFDASFDSFEQRVLPELHRQRHRGTRHEEPRRRGRRREEACRPRRGRAALRDEPSRGHDHQRHRLHARAEVRTSGSRRDSSHCHAHRCSGSATAWRPSPPTAASSCTRRRRSMKGTWAASSTGSRRRRRWEARQRRVNLDFLVFQPKRRNRDLTPSTVGLDGPVMARELLTSQRRVTRCQASGVGVPDVCRRKNESR